MTEPDINIATEIGPPLLPATEAGRACLRMAMRFCRRSGIPKDIAAAVDWDVISAEAERQRLDAASQSGSDE